jgi:ribosomal protein L31
MNKNTDKKSKPLNQAPKIQGPPTKGSAISKKDLARPEMQIVTVSMTNGDNIQVKMFTKEKHLQVKRLSIDAHSHHAWQTAATKATTSQVQKFMDKFSKKKIS